MTDRKGSDLLDVGHDVRSKLEIDLTRDTPETILDKVAEDSDRKGLQIQIDGIREIHHAHGVNMSSIVGTTNRLPRYLFRAFSRRSGGINGVGRFQSQAVKQGHPRNVESLTEAEMVVQLRKHVTNEGFESHLISFSLSYMWALHRALAMKEKGQEHVRLAVVDTWDIPLNTWVRYSHAMLEAYRVESKLWRQNLGRGEVFVWDELRVPMSVANFGDMLKGGVLKLLPIYHLANFDLSTGESQACLPLTISL